VDLRGRVCGDFADSAFHLAQAAGNQLALLAPLRNIVFCEGVGWGAGFFSAAPLSRGLPRLR
jgi:hypothetical protein